MTTRRQLLQLSALSGAAMAAGAAPPVGTTKPQTTAALTPTSASGKSLNILILGGTGFTGPSQVKYALSRGHKVTLFNRGRRPKDWPAEVEELVGGGIGVRVSCFAGSFWST